MKTDYKKLKLKIEEVILIVDDIIDFSRSILEDKTKPLVDRFFFSHIFNLFHFYWNVLFNTCETIETLLQRDEKERTKYLLTNLPENTNTEENL